MYPNLDRLIESETSSAVLTAEEAREQCRIADDSEDRIIASYMAAAEAFISSRYGLEFGRAKRLAKWEIELSGIDRLYLPFSPVIEVESVKANGAPVTPRFEAGGVCAYLDFGAELPRKSRIEAEYSCGFEGGIPENIRQAVRLLTAFYYDNRDAAQSLQTHNIQFSVDALMEPWKKPAIY